MKAKSLLSAAIILTSTGAALANNPVVTLKSTDPSRETSFDTGTRWSDGQAPQSGVDYLVADDPAKAVNNRIMFRTPENGSNYIFSGESLTISNANVNLKGSGQVTIGDFRLYGCRIAQGIANPINLHGTTTVHGTTSAYSRFTGSANRITRLYGILQGSGEIQINNTENETGSFYLELYGDNTDFTGGIRIVGPHELRLHHAGALGAPLAAPRVDSLRLADGGGLYAAVGMTLDATRGITLANGGTLRTGDAALTIASVISGTGDLTIRGGGPVTLNNAMTYTGNTVISNGTLRLVSDLSLPDGSRVITKDGINTIEGSGFIGDIVTESGTVSIITGTGGDTPTVSNLVTTGGALRFDMNDASDTDFIRLTGSISNALATPIPVSYPAQFPCDCPPPRRLLTAPNLAEIGAAAFATHPEQYGLPEGEFSIDTDGGEDFLVFTQPRPVIIVTADNADTNNGFAYGTLWSDGQVPTSDKDYLTLDKLLRTPPSNGTQKFGGSSLTLAGSASDMRTKSLRTVIDDLRLYAGRITQGGSDRTQYLEGNIAIFSEENAPFNFEIETDNYSTNPRRLAIEAPLTGVGPIRFRALTPKSSQLHEGGHFILAADNTAFTGPVTINGTRNIELLIADETNLGGNPAAFRANQLTIEAAAVLCATNTLTLDDPNRGITLGTGGGALRAYPGTAFTVAAPIAGTGSLTARGPGTVVLGGANSFTGRTIIDTNATVEARSPTAFGTNSVTFLSGASLRIPHDPAALPLGLRLGAPLTSEDDTLPVTPIFGEPPLSKVFEMPLFLLTSATATVDTAAIAPQNKPAGYAVSVETRLVNDNGTERTQVYLKYRWGGMIFMLQ